MSKAVRLDRAQKSSNCGCGYTNQTGDKFVCKNLAITCGQPKQRPKLKRALVLVHRFLLLLN